MVIATVGAMCIKELPEAVMVMLLFQIGEFLQDKAVDKSKDSITKLMDIRPEYANKVTADGIIKVSPQEVNLDDIKLNIDYTELKNRLLDLEIKSLI